MEQLTIEQSIKQRYKYWVGGWLRIYNKQIKQYVFLPMWQTLYWDYHIPLRQVKVTNKQGRQLIFETNTFDWSGKVRIKVRRFNLQYLVASLVFDIRAEQLKKEPDIEEVYKVYLHIEKQGKRWYEERISEHAKRIAKQVAERRKEWAEKYPDEEPIQIAHFG